MENRAGRAPAKKGKKKKFKKWKLGKPKVGNDGGAKRFMLWLRGQREVWCKKKKSLRTGKKKGVAPTDQTTIQRPKPKKGAKKRENEQ